MHANHFYLVNYFLGYRCQNCGKMYKAKSSLMRHVKFECSKEAAFLCPYCNYASKQKAPLLGHVKRKHEEMFTLFSNIYYNPDIFSTYVKNCYA